VDAAKSLGRGIVPAWPFGTVRCLGVAGGIVELGRERVALWYDRPRGEGMADEVIEDIPLEKLL
jgi:hypothetical protein